MNKYMGIGELAKELGVHIMTLRRWEKRGIVSSERTGGNHRRYDAEEILKKLSRKISMDSFDGKEPETRRTIAYARVSSRDQKNDLERQKQVLELFCSAKGWCYEILSDLGSGMNYRKKGLQKLIAEILNDKVERIVLTHKDRLLRFGAELIFSICK